MFEPHNDSNQYLSTKHNPENVNEPIFFRNRIHTSFKSKQKITYKNIDKYLEKKKSLICSTDEQMIKTSSCLSSNKKYDYVGDMIENNTYNIREKSKNHQCLFRKKSKSTKSVERKMPTLTPQAEEKLASRITIHYLRSQKQAYQLKRKQLENQYSFQLKKLSKLKKLKDMQQLREEKLQKIKYQKRKLSEDIRKHCEIEEENQKRVNQYKKNETLKQRAKRKSSVAKKLAQNRNSALQIKNLQQQIHEQMEQSYLLDFNKRRKLFEKGKRDEEKRKINISRLFQTRKQQAKRQFRNKWLCELQQAQLAKQQVIQTKQEISKNMKEILYNWNRILDKNIQ